MCCCCFQAGCKQQESCNQHQVCQTRPNSSKPQNKHKHQVCGGSAQAANIGITRLSGSAAALDDMLTDLSPPRANTEFCPFVKAGDEGFMRTRTGLPRSLGATSGAFFFFFPCRHRFKASLALTRSVYMKM